MARILLADDDAGARDFARRALEMDGHTVTALPDGNEAFEKLKATPDYDILVSDVNMPGLDGIELAEKALEVAPGIKLVLMSGFADVLERAGKLKSHGARLLAKPVPIEKLRAEVRAALSA
jgi:two-component system cell cycle response regulator CpdR